MSEKPTYELKGTLRKDCMTTPMTWSSVNLPELLSATTTLVDPDRFFFLRTNKSTGTLIGDDNTGRAGSIFFPTHKHSTKIQNSRASPKLYLKTLLQIPIGQVHEKILKK